MDFSTPFVPTWRHRASLITLLSAFKGHEKSFRFIGGCVRDALLDLDSQDIDLATSFSPDELQRLLEQAGLKTLDYGKDHGTITALIKKDKYEITTLRQDIETDGRRARVRFTDDWIQDAARRDFTFNAIFLDLEGRLFDPFKGYQDLIAGHVRFIGDPRARIEEDALRLLRFFRFQAFYGKVPPSPKVLEICKSLRANLKTLSKERIAHEICLLLQAPCPQTSLSNLDRTGILQTILNPPFFHQALERLLSLEKTYRLQQPLLVRLITFFGWNPLNFIDLKRPNKDLKTLLQLKELIASSNSLTEVCYRHPDLFVMYIFLKETLYHIPLIQKGLDLLTHWQQPKFPLTGRDLHPLGLEGKKLGDLLKMAEQRWIDDNFRTQKKELIDFVQKHITHKD